MGCISDELLAAFVAGEATPAELESIEVHLAECASCTQVCRAASLVEDVRGPTLLDPTTVRFERREVPRGTAIGRFLVLEVVGWGGMGVVYAAYDPQLDRRVALKFLANSVDPIRLHREARAIARLAHPNVVGIHDVGEHQGAPFVAMELVAGTTLDRHLAKPWTSVLRLLLQAGEGLAAAHAAGVIHRDFKPSNVLVGEDGRVRVSDFGLARLADRAEDSTPGADTSSGPGTSSDRTTRVGTRIGTPAYMAPEQHANGDVDARADQFSFAMTAHEALLGCRPSTLTIDPANGTDVPDSVRAAIKRAMSPDPSERFPSMTSLLDVLRAHDPTDPRNVGQAALEEAGRRTQRSKRLLWGALTLTFALIAAAAIVMTLVARGQRDRARETEALARHAEQLAQQRLDDELRLNVRLAFERGDSITSLSNVAKLFARGIDEPMLRMVAGTASWAWPYERTVIRGVRSVIPAGDRALVELEREVVVIDDQGTVLMRTPIGNDSHGIDIDERGELLLTADPDLRIIPVAHPDRARVLVKSSTEMPLFPQVLGPNRFGAVVGTDIRVFDENGTEVRRIDKRAGPGTRLRASRRLAVGGTERTTITSVLTGKSVAYTGEVTGIFERETDQAVAFTAPGRVTIVDANMRVQRTIEVGGDPRFARFSPNGRLVAIAIDDDLAIYDLATGLRRARIASHAGTPIVFDNDGILTAVDGIVSWWNLDGVLRGSFVAPTRTIDRIWRIGSQLAVYGGGILQLYADPFVAPPTMPGGCAARRIVHATADGALVVCSDNHLWRWSGTTRTRLTTREIESPSWVIADPSHHYAVVLRFTELEIIANDRSYAVPFALETILDLVATPSAIFVGLSNGTIRRFDVATRAWTDIGITVAADKNTFITAMTPLGTSDRALAVLARTALVEVDPHGIGTPRTLPSAVEQIVTSGDGAVLATRSADGAITVLDHSTLRPLHPTPSAIAGATASFALDRTGERLAVITTSGRIAIVDSRAGTTLIDLAFGHVAVTDVAFAADGESLVVNLAGTPTRVALPFDRLSAEVLTRELGCRFDGASCP